MLVFDSWYSQQARIYRHQMHVSDEWGTAVIVQAMVFGNLNENSGSGVIFTRDPRGSSQNVALYGDFIFGVQGDDIVSGLVETYPISERQRVSEKRQSLISLEKRFPEIYGELVRIAEFLVYEKRFNHQEIEFTFETASPRGLFILQTRDMVQRGAGKVVSFRDSPELERSQLGIGIGVSGGALARVSFPRREAINLASRMKRSPSSSSGPTPCPMTWGSSSRWKASSRPVEEAHPTPPSPSPSSTRLVSWVSRSFTCTRQRRTAPVTATPSGAGTISA